MADQKPNETLKAYVRVFKQLPRPAAAELLALMGDDDEFAPSSQIMQAALVTVAGNRLFAEHTGESENTSLDRDAADRVHDTDPRVRRLAAARWRLKTGGSHELWLSLGDNPAALLDEARDWLRAAVAAGILQPQEPPR